MVEGILRDENIIIGIENKKLTQIFICFQSIREKIRQLADSPIKGEVTLEDEKRMRQLLPFHLAPEYLRFNPYILKGYRGYLTTKLCIERWATFHIFAPIDKKYDMKYSFFSMFWWTNETINIWSHILGCALFLGLTFYDLCLVKIHAPMIDKILVALLLVCFQVG